MSDISRLRVNRYKIKNWKEWLKSREWEKSIKEVKASIEL
jgi:hypothetical protein